MKALAAIFLVAIGTAAAQPVCPPVNFQQLAQFQVESQPQSLVSGLLRQADGSFTQYEITGNVKNKTASVVKTVPNIQLSFFDCSGVKARNPGAGPAPNLSKDPLGTASRNGIITDLPGNGIGAIVGPNFPYGHGQLAVGAANADFTLGYVGGFTVGPTPMAVVAGDFNGDGKHDVATVYYGPVDNSAPGGISLLLGTGDGDLQPAVNYTAGLGTTAAAAWDFNHDGKDDLAVLNNIDATVTIIFGGADGKLTKGNTYSTGQPFSSPNGIAIADVSGDGIPDLLVSSFQGITVLLGNGDGTFRNGPFTTLSTTQSFLGTGDFNKDGKTDVAVMDFDTGLIYILLGNNDGTFTQFSQYQIGQGTSGIEQLLSVGFWVEDFDRDGNPDIVFAQGHPDALIMDVHTQTVGVLFGNGDGTFAGAPAYLVPGNPNTMVAADFNGDGKQDLAINARPGYISILLGDGVGGFRAAPTVRAGGVDCCAQAVAGDLNGDGKMDLVINNLVFLGNGDGTFQVPKTVPAGSETSGVAIGDFNNDHKLDLAIVNRLQDSVTIVPGNGNGTFGTGVTVAVGDDPTSIITGDFNHDGNLDLAVINIGTVFMTNAPGSFSILLGKGDGTFQNAVNYKLPANIWPSTISSGDFNNDGIPDLIMTAATEDFGYTLAVFLGNGDGTFKPWGQMPTEFGPGNLAVADFNHDGNLDLVVPHCCGDTDITYALGNGDGTFQPEVPITYNGGALTSTVADFNGDGKPDIAFATGVVSPDDSSVFVFLSVASTTPSCAYTLGSTSEQAALAGGNFNITIQTSASCKWTVTGLPSWITVSGSSSGTGPGSVTLVVVANTGQARSAAIKIANTTVTVNQAGAFTCTFTLNSTQIQATVAGGNFSVNLTTGSLCTWSVTGLPNWITVQGSALGTGSAVITLVVAANAGAVRNATITIGSATVTVNQAAPVVCTYTLNAAGQVFPSAGGTANITITAPAGCSWSASGNPNWVVFKSAAAGSGSGTLAIQVGLNTGADRSGVIQIASATFTIEQVSASLANGIVAGSMAQIASAGGWKTTFTLINTGNTTAQIRLNFFDNNGNPLALALTFPQSATQQPGAVPAFKRAAAAPAGPLLAATLDRTVNAGASLVIETTGPDADTTLVGWAQLISTGNVGGFATFTVSASHQEAVVPLETRNASVYLLAFDNTGGLLTGLALANNSAQAAVIPILIRDDTGTQIGSLSINLPSHGHTSFMLANTYAITGGKRGIIEFHTPPGGQISVLGLRANAAALTTLPLLANVTAGGGSIAHVASAGGWKTTFTFVNAGPGSAQITVDFSDDNGNSLALPLGFPQTGTNAVGSSVTRTLAPNTSIIMETEGLSTDGVVTGSARLTTVGNVGGFAIFRDGGTGQEAVVPLETRIGGAFILAFDNTNGLATGLALANIVNQNAGVFVVLRDDTGASLGTTTINLKPDGHTSFLLTQTYAATAGKRGTVEFDTPPGGRISALGLRATPNATLTTIPVLTK